MNITPPTTLLELSSPGVRNVAESKRMAKQVESMFASMLIKSMRQTLGDEGLFPGDQSDALGGLFDMYMGQQVASGGGLGISEMMEAYATQAKGQSNQGAGNES